MIDKQLQQAGRIAKFFPPATKWGLQFTNRILRQSVGLALDGVDSQTVWIEQSEGEGVVRVRVFRPPSQAALPIVLYLHGGGYAIGAPEQGGLFNVYKGLMETRPCVIVAPDYRLSFDDPYPAGLNDCYDTLLWVKDHAAEIGGRADQIFVLGDSAGGGLAIAVCLLARDRGDVNIAFQMPLYPMIDDRQINPSAVNNTMPVWSSKHNKIAWELYLRGLMVQGKSIPAYAAPSRADSYADLPPAATFVGGLDPFLDETVAYVKGLNAAHIPVQFTVFPHCYHGFEHVVPDADVSQKARQFMNAAYAYAVDNYFAEQAERGSARIWENDPLKQQPSRRMTRPKMREMKAVGAEYAFSGSNSTTLRQVINKPVEAVFASFEDAAAWKEWLGLDVEWTSEKPFGVGTTRTVRANGQVIDETFFTWEKPLRMGFRFDRATLPLAAFAEDYTLTRMGPDRCELAWTFAFEWGGFGGVVFGRIFHTLFTQSGKRSLKKLAQMMASTERYD